MNTLLLKYAIEVDKTGSISKAAENLYMNQPQLSKAIKELEDMMGVAIFNRTSKGVVTTKKGKEFLIMAESVLDKIHEMESLCFGVEKDLLKFEISVPRATYIAKTFAEFVGELTNIEKINIEYIETETKKAIDNVASNDHNLGIIRYQKRYEQFFINILNEKGLKYDVIYEFEYRLLMSAKSPLASYETVPFKKLSEFIQISNGDEKEPYIMGGDTSSVKPPMNKKEIHIYERASQFELLFKVPSTYMWVSPVPKDILMTLGLVEKLCEDNKNTFKDILIYKKGYKLTDTDKLFISMLKSANNPD